MRARRPRGCTVGLSPTVRMEPRGAPSLCQGRGCVPRVQVSANLTRDVVGEPSPPHGSPFQVAHQAVRGGPGRALCEFSLTNTTGGVPFGCPHPHHSEPPFQVAHQAVRGLDFPALCRPPIGDQNHLHRRLPESAKALWPGHLGHASALLHHDPAVILAGVSRL